jgi:large subunit ribosomal protein L14
MISLLTKVHIIDNSGGVLGRCIKVLKPHNRKHANIGDLIVISILKTIPSSKIRKGDVYKAIVVRTVSSSHYGTGNVIFNTNSVILVKTTPKSIDLTPIASSIKGVLPYILKYRKGCGKLLALAGVKRTIF